MTLGKWLDRWLDEYEYMAGAVRPSTLQTYRRYADLYIKPTLGYRPLIQITPTEIQKLYAHLKERGRVRRHKKYGHQLFDSMVHCIHILLHGAMSAAEQLRLIPRNPVVEVTAPKWKLPPSTVQCLRKRREAVFADWIFSNPLKPELPVNPRAAYSRLKSLADISRGTLDIKIQRPSVFSVCGQICGQIKNAKLKVPKKVLIYKKTPGFCRRFSPVVDGTIST